MKSRRIHVMGASGASTTTLGRALADALAVPDVARAIAKVAGWAG
jgi:adenylate kinase family enzyme